MARFAVIGALAMDRPVRLSAPLLAGARLRGVSLRGELAGRLGGGGANAGVALLKAGHEVAIATLVAEDDEGGAALAAARDAGLDVGQVGRRPGASRTTMILVDSAGERTIIGLDLDSPIVLPDLPAPNARFDGVLVRSAYPGAEAWARASRGPVVVHYPFADFSGPADVLVGSADDLSDEMLADPLAVGRARMGERLRWAVVTHGAAGATAYGEGRTASFTPSPARVVDATGAGDIFAAGLLEALTLGGSMEMALAHACAWGGAAVGLDSSAPLEASAGAFSSFRPASP